MGGKQRDKKKAVAGLAARAVGAEEEVGTGEEGMGANRDTEEKRSGGVGMRKKTPTRVPGGLRVGGGGGRKSSSPTPPLASPLIMTTWSYLLSNLAYHDHNVRASLFAWLISHQPAVLFSQNKPATNKQSAVLFSQNKPAPAISHQPNERATT
jgi:hypothetical protein